MSDDTEVSPLRPNWANEIRLFLIEHLPRTPSECEKHPAGRALDALADGRHAAYDTATHEAVERGELERLRKAESNAAHWHECFQALERAVVGESGLSAIHAAERLRADARRLRLFEQWADKGYAPALVFDDDGRWAVSFTSASPVPPDGGFTDTEQVSVLVEPHEWHDSVNAAIDAAQQEGSKDA